MRAPCLTWRRVCRDPGCSLGVLQGSRRQVSHAVSERQSRKAALHRASVQSAIEFCCGDHRPRAVSMLANQAQQRLVREVPCTATRHTCIHRPKSAANLPQRPSAASSCEQQRRRLHALPTFDGDDSTSSGVRPLSPEQCQELMDASLNPHCVTVMLALHHEPLPLRAD